MFLRSSMNIIDGTNYCKQVWDSFHKRNFEESKVDILNVTTYSKHVEDGSNNIQKKI